MIKGRYVAQIEVDFEKEDSRVPVAEMRDRLRGEWIHWAVEVAVRRIFDKKAVIAVTTQYADVYEATEGETE